MATISINQWNTFQPRKDRANHIWFRVDNTIIFSETLDGLTADQKWFWICLLAYASKKQSGVFEYNAPYFEKHFGVSKKKMDEALKSLSDTGAVTFECGGSQTPTDTNSLATDRQTDRQTYIQTPASPEFDFDSLYQSYPRKRGKDAGMRRLKSRIKDQDTFDAFARAVRKYASECRLQRTDPKYVMYWSSFVGTDEKEPWHDFSDPSPVAPPVLCPEIEQPPPELDLTPEQRAEAAANVRELMAKTGNLGRRKEGA